MKKLLTITALFEAATGLALVVVPSMVASLLLGVPLESATGMVVAHLAGAALLCLGLICWFARNDASGHVVKTMLLYNVAATAVMIDARVGFGLMGVALWPAVVIHAILAAWCITSLWSK